MLKELRPRSREEHSMPTTDTAQTDFRLQSTGFLPEYLLQRYLELGFVQRIGPRQIATPQQRYILQDAVRVLGPRSQESDPFGLTGHVSPTRALLERGFELSRRQLSWGRYRYDMEFGFLVHPIADADSSGPRPRLVED